MASDYKNSEVHGKGGLNMKRSLWCIVILSIFLFLSVAPSQALVGLGFGLRGGTVSVDDPNTEKSLTGVTMLGAHLRVGTLPILDLEASAEYARKKYDFSFPVPGVGEQSAEATYHLVSLNGTAKYNFSIVAVPIKPYLGGGLGMHFMASTVDLPELQTTVPIDSDFDESKAGIHGLAGLALSFPLFPLEIFAEGRRTLIFTEDETTSENAFYAGLTLKMP